MSRLDRINSLMRTEIAAILQKKISDKRLGFISITRVEVSKDLHNARVFYSQIGDQKEKLSTQKCLRSASGFIKGELGKVVQLRTMPDLHFVFDESVEKAFDLVNKINQLSQC